MRQSTRMKTFYNRDLKLAPNHGNRYKAMII